MCRYAEKCCEMGGDWLDVHPFLEEPRYFDVEKIHEEYMDEKWKEYLDQKQAAEIAPEAAEEMQPARQPGTSSQGDNVGSEVGKGSGAAGQKPALKRLRSKANLDGAGGEGTARDKTDSNDSLPELMKDTNRVKTQYHSVTSSARALVAQIEASDDWVWANTPAHAGVLRDRLEELSANVNDFAGRALITDVAKMKKDTAAESMVLELRKFKDLRRPIDKVAFEHKKLLDQFDIMHRKPISPAKAKKQRSAKAAVSTE